MVAIAVIAITVVAFPAAGARAQSLASANVPVADVFADSSDSATAASRANVDSTPPWITKRELLGGGISVLATIAVAPLDKPVSAELQEAGWQKDEPLHSASQALAFAGGPGPFLG